jgi:hypothetical protein
MENYKRVFKKFLQQYKVEEEFMKNYRKDFTKYLKEHSNKKDFKDREFFKKSLEELLDKTSPEEFLVSCFSWTSTDNPEYWSELDIKWREKLKRIKDGK